MTETKAGWHLRHSYADLPEKLYSKLSPQPVKAPRLVLLNRALGEELGLDFRGIDAESLGAWFSGNSPLPGAQPLAQAYAGHQFGHFAILGDGRAHLLGEQEDPQGRLWDIQLKGSGQTPYSRRGDGRATFKAMLREYLISEAMQHLRIPSSRSLAVCLTGEPVVRETTQPGAVLCRVAASHLRVGTFEYAARVLPQAVLQALLDYSIERHYPQIREAENPALAFLEAVMRRQIDLVVNWTRVGFIHGVMNTDNMSISGQTFDYGPCAFMNAYDPGTVFSSIDQQGRYAFGNQPPIAHWNLACLGGALLPLIHADKNEAIRLAKACLDRFPAEYEARWLVMMRGKIGLDEAQDGDKALILDLLAWMQAHQADYTLSFLELAKAPHLQAPLYQGADFQAWYERWRQRTVGQAPEALQSRMQAHNPRFIPRNQVVEQALDQAAEQGDLQLFHRLLDYLAQPYAANPEAEALLSPPENGDRGYQTFCGT